MYFFLSILLRIYTTRLTYRLYEHIDCSQTLLSVDRKHASIQNPQCKLYNSIFNSPFYTKSKDQDIFSCVTNLDDNFISEILNDLGGKNPIHDVKFAMFKRINEYNLKNQNLTFNYLSDILNGIRKNISTITVVYGVRNSNITFINIISTRKSVGSKSDSLDCVYIIQSPANNSILDLYNLNESINICGEGKCDVNFCNTIIKEGGKND